MVDFFGKVILVDSIKTALGKIVERIVNGYFDTTPKRAKLSEAITAIKQATLVTNNFIKQNGYRENTDLSDLWHKALNACIAADLNDGLPSYLYHKAEFWGSPQEWLENESSLEIIPKLEELKLVCDSLMVRLTG